MRCRFAGRKNSSARSRGSGRGAPPTNTALTVQGLPLLKPPYSTISAIDLDSGEIRWQVPTATLPTPSAITRH